MAFLLGATARSCWSWALAAWRGVSSACLEACYSCCLGMTSEVAPCMPFEWFRRASGRSQRAFETPRVNRMLEG